MSSNIDIPKLTEAFSDGYNVEELEIFLAKYFKLRLDRIVIPQGLSIEKIVGEIIGYFDRRGNLLELVRELGCDRPGKIDIRDLLMPSFTGSLPTKNRTVNA